MTFSRDFRGNFPNRVCRHFDKYCEITNPLDFDPIEDVYRPAFSEKNWKALNTLLDDKDGRECVQQSSSFDLYLPDKKKGTHKYNRSHITFGFHDSKWRPSLDIEYDNLPEDTRAHIDKFVMKARALRSLRKILWSKTQSLVDHGWDRCGSWDPNRGSWRGCATPGMGCNTPGQVFRIWPELLPYLPLEFRDKVRGAAVKSRLPEYIKNWGSPAQFRCEEPRWLNKEDKTRVPDEEWEQDKRIHQALSSILTTMSLMTDVPHIEGYPSIC